MGDIEDIQQVKYRYLRALDTKHWDDFAETLTEDVIGDYGSSLGEEHHFTDRDSLVEEQGRARMVKPVACLCAFEARLEERLQALEKRIPAPAPVIDVPQRDPKGEVNPATGAVTRPVVDGQGGSRA